MSSITAAAVCSRNTSCSNPPPDCRKRNTRRDGLRHAEPFEPVDMEIHPRLGCVVRVPSIADGRSERFSCKLV